MTEQGTSPGTSRRRFLGGAAAAGVGLAAGAAVVTGYGITSANDAANGSQEASTASGAIDGALAVVPFYGTRQAGITTAQQERLMFAALDVTTTDVQELQRMLGRWAAIGPTHGREDGQRLTGQNRAATVRNRRGLGPGAELTDHHRRVRTQPVRRAIRPCRPDAGRTDPVRHHPWRRRDEIGDL